MCAVMICPKCQSRVAVRTRRLSPGTSPRANRAFAQPEGSKPPSERLCSRKIPLVSRDRDSIGPFERTLARYSKSKVQKKNVAMETAPLQISARCSSGWAPDTRGWGGPGHARGHPPSGLGFARVWCARRPSLGGLEFALLRDYIYCIK